MVDDTDRVWALMEKISICMLSTRDGEQIRSRPMGAYVRRQENAVYFLTDVRRHKDDEIQKFPNVCLAFADASGGWRAKAARFACSMAWMVAEEMESLFEGACAHARNFSGLSCPELACV